jgi:hypothetical protein
VKQESACLKNSGEREPPATSHTNTVTYIPTILNPWLRHAQWQCARKIYVLRQQGINDEIKKKNPDGVIGIFMALELTEPLKEMSKGDRCAGLITLPPSCAKCLEIWEPEP